jgi:hypothetical protein
MLPFSQIMCREPMSVLRASPHFGDTAKQNGNLPDGNT